MPPLDHLAEQWPRIDALLDEALDLPVAQHPSWLAGLTGEDAALCEVLRGLLAAHVHAMVHNRFGELPRLDTDLPDPAGD
ncbi:hypothetical protein BH09PSE6_BH09PSE6_10910 [soil metagenome]